MRCHIIHITHLKYTTQWALVYSDLITMTTVNFRIFFLSQKETSNPHWSQHLPLSLASFSSVAQSCPTLCDPMDCSTPGFPVYHQVQELTQTHDHRVSDVIQPSHPLSSPPAFNLSQHRSFPMSQFFTSGGQSIGVSASTSVLPMNIQDWFPLGWTGWIFS